MPHFPIEPFFFFFNHLHGSSWCHQITPSLRWPPRPMNLGQTWHLHPHRYPLCLQRGPVVLGTPGLHPSSESLGFLSRGCAGGGGGDPSPREGKPRPQSPVPLMWVGNPVCPSSPNVSSSRENLEPETETESVVSLRRERPRRRDSSEHGGEGARPAGWPAWQLGRVGSAPGPRGQARNAPGLPPELPGPPQLGATGPAAPRGWSATWPGTRAPPPS